MEGLTLMKSANRLAIDSHRHFKPLRSQLQPRQESGCAMRGEQFQESHEATAPWDPQPGQPLGRSRTGRWFLSCATGSKAVSLVYDGDARES